METGSVQGILQEVPRVLKLSGIPRKNSGIRIED